MSAQNRKLRVGVTIALRDGAQSIWENGIFQNCAFLVQLLNQSPAVKRAVLVNGGDAVDPGPDMMLKDRGIAIMGLAEALQSLDVVIEMSALLPGEWVTAFRAKGGRNAWMRVGNDYVIDIERAMFNKPGGSLLLGKKFDAIWTLPQYEYSCLDYFSLTARAPVRIVPHLWSPQFFDRGIATLQQGVRFGYQPGRPRWRVCCFEPNMCLVKTSIIPMACVEEAYRARPAFLERFHVMNTAQIKDNPSFLHYARSLDVVNHGLASFDARFTVYEVMAKLGDCVISHQWENAQNYLYYELLYGDYPLVHNSPILRGHGYYYPDFDSQEGGQALLRAFDQHDAGLDSYRAKTKALMRELDYSNPANIDTYTRELLALFPES